jgi:hypothetical protein
MAISKQPAPGRFERCQIVAIDVRLRSISLYEGIFGSMTTSG